jgi:Arc/MetJ-type ribon-helix-helix transcriptional regulator
MYMRSHHITLSEPLSRVVETQIKTGRFKDFSAAIQEAVWNYFQGVPDSIAEYGLTPEEVDKAFDRDMVAVEKERKEGKLKAFDL